LFGVKIAVIEGIVTSGIGEGSFFMSMDHYKNEIKKKLGFDAYPGTLNLKIDTKQYDLLKNFNSTRIDGFNNVNKKLGGANCYKAKIKNINGSIIIPDLTKHKKDIIEFIAPVHLKSKLKINDGDKIKVELFQ